jgi:hypothetical protein
MAEKRLTDKAEREFAGDEGFMIQEAGGPDLERKAIILGQAGNPQGHLDDLTAHVPDTEGATALDEALATRRAVARKPG